MKISILVNYDLSSALALNCLLPELLKHEVSVFYTRKTPHRLSFPRALAELAEYEMELLESPVAGFRNFSGLPGYIEQLACLNNVNQGSDFELLCAAQPELILSIRHMTILQGKVIGLPARGIINLHSGLQPEYQGVMASFWAMLNQEQLLGTTLHRIEDSSIDSGAVITRTACAAQYHKSYLWNVLNLYREGYEVMLEAVNSLTAGDSLQFTEQQGVAHYYSFPSDEDIAQFHQQGNVLFDKSESQKLRI